MQLKILYFIFSLAPASFTPTEYRFERNLQVPTANHHLQYSSQQQEIQQHSWHSTAPVAYEKQYFFFNAPEETSVDYSQRLAKFLNSFKKHQQVTFIRTPINEAHHKALETVLQNSIEKQIHVFVYSQRPNFDSLLEKTRNLQLKPEVNFVKYADPAEIQSLQSSIIDRYGAASDNKPFYVVPSAKDNEPVSKNYAMNFLPSGIDVVPGSSYIPLFAL